MLMMHVVDRTSLGMSVHDTLQRSAGFSRVLFGVKVLKALYPTP